MVNLTIEGRQVTVPAGTSILEAAKTAGVLIPHYCYHPGLPVAGVCRMCLVEVEKAPKLAPVVRDVRWRKGRWCTSTREKALEARKGVLEMLLINHPLDCPICDQVGRVRAAGLHVPGRPRARAGYRDPKRFNPVEDFGGDVMYVAEPLHPLHALRALHGRRRARSGAQRQRARRPRVDRQVRGQGPHASVGGERHRPLPGGRAALQGLPQQGARVGARSHARPSAPTARRAAT